RVISADLEEKDYIEKSFEQAIIERENNFPTGLQLEEFSIAIPHTDVIHIKKPFVAVYRLKNSINFYQMGTDDVVVSVKDLLVLVINEPKKQVGLLATLMEYFSNTDFVQQFK